MKNEMNPDKPRLVYIDNIRSWMIILVIFMHAAVTYSGLGSWYYVENPKVDFFSLIFFAFIQMYMQAFFMGLLYMISGYFAAASLERKGSGRFVTNRLVRLGIPTLFYLVFLHVLNIKIIHPDLNIFDYYAKGIKSLRIISWTGPMWFAAALLIFSLIYAGLKKLPVKFKLTKINPSWKTVGWLVFIIADLAFILRIFFPMGTSVLNFQLCFFSSYIILFAAGILAYPSGFFDTIDKKAGKKYLLFSLIISIPLWFLLMLFGGPVKGVMRFGGGLYWQALAWALLESYICVTFSFGLIGIFRHHANTPTRLNRFLANQSFAVYVFHPTILITSSILLKKWVLPPVVKFLLVGIVAAPICFLIAFCLRRIPFLKKVFS